MESPQKHNFFQNSYTFTVRSFLFRFRMVPYAVLAGGIFLSFFQWRLVKSAGDTLLNQGVLPLSVLIMGLSVTLLFAGIIFFYVRSYHWAVVMADATTRKIQEKTKELANKVEIIEEKNRNLEEVKTKMVHLMKDLRMEKRVIEEEKVKNEALLKSIGDGVIATDKNEVIQMVNKAAEIILGYRAKDLVGKSFFEAVGMEDGEEKNLSKEETPVHKALSTGQKITNSLTNFLYLVGNNNAKFPADIVTTPVILKGNLVGAVMVFRDITKEWDIDKSKTEFVSLASHQLRTPLSTIGWYAEMLLAGDAGKINKEQEDYIKEIYNGNQRMVELVNSLLNVSRIELGTLAVDPEMTDFASVCESVLKELRPSLLAKKIKLAKKYDKEISSISADPKLIRIIFQNLLTNAIKYTPEGGKINVKIFCQEPDVVIEVSDNGYGIPEHQKDKIFTKLFRADNAKEKEAEGTGLGLYIVKLIVDTAKGKIWFDSKENKGTTFHIAMPLSGMERKEGRKSLIE